MEESTNKELSEFFNAIRDASKIENLVAELEVIRAHLQVAYLEVKMLRTAAGYNPDYCMSPIPE